MQLQKKGHIKQTQHRVHIRLPEHRTSISKQFGKSVYSRTCRDLFVDGIDPLRGMVREKHCQVHLEHVQGSETGHKVQTGQPRIVYLLLIVLDSVTVRSRSATQSGERTVNKDGHLGYPSQVDLSMDHVLEKYIQEVTSVMYKQRTENTNQPCYIRRVVLRRSQRTNDRLVRRPVQPPIQETSGIYHTTRYERCQYKFTTRRSHGPESLDEGNPQENIPLFSNPGQGSP